MKTFFLLFLFLFFCPLSEGKAGDLSLSLSEAIRIALTHNLDIQAEKENIHLQEAIRQTEESRFDPNLELNTDIKRLVRGSTSFSETGLTGQDILDQEDLEVRLEWKKPFRWGGEYGLTLRQLRTDATFQRINPTYRGDLSLRVTQPLLSGFGQKIKQAPLKIAKAQVGISRQQFMSRVMEILLKVISLYWELLFQRENLLVKQDSLALANRLLEINKTKVALGVMAPIEILVAEAAVASREEAVLVAQKEVENVEDQFRQLLNRMGTSSEGEGNLLLSDHPVEEEVSLGPKDLLEWALKGRPEMEAAKLQIQNKVLSVQRAENQLRPSLDFIGALGPSGTGTSLSDSLDQLFARGAPLSGDFYRWEAGLLFSYPIGNRAAAAELKKEKAQQKKARIEKEKLVQQIRLEVAEGVRRIRTDFQRLQATRRALDLARKQHAAAEERFHLGLLSSHDLIAFQNEVTTASGNALRAVTDYNKSLANIDRVTGALLTQYPIEVLPSEEAVP